MMPKFVCPVVQCLPETQRMLPCTVVQVLVSVGAKCHSNWRPGGVDEGQDQHSRRVRAMGEKPRRSAVPPWEGNDVENDFGSIF
jgi:hypothetical protein